MKNEEIFKNIRIELRKLDMNELSELISRKEGALNLMSDIEKVIDPTEERSRYYSIEILKSIKSIVQMMNVR